MLSVLPPLLLLLLLSIAVANRACTNGVADHAIAAVDAPLLLRPMPLRLLMLLLLLLLISWLTRCFLQICAQLRYRQVLLPTQLPQPPLRRLRRVLVGAVPERRHVHRVFHGCARERLQRVNLD